MSDRPSELDASHALEVCVQLPEPPTSDSPSRIRAQEEYLGKMVSPWVLDRVLGQATKLHSIHIMRYLDPRHLGEIGGIALVFRFLGRKQILATERSGLVDFFEGHQQSGAIARHRIDEPRPWPASVGPEYGGEELAEPWAQFLGAASRLALHLLAEPQRSFEAREMVVRNWQHCLSLITRGIG